MPPRNRREFLKLAAATAVAANSPLTWASTSSTAPCLGNIPRPADAGDQAASLAEAAIKERPGSRLTRVPASRRFWDSARLFTDASCYLLSELAPEKRQALLADLLGPEGLRLSVGRTASGRAIIRAIRTAMTTARIPIPTCRNSALSTIATTSCRRLREAQKVNQELFLFSSPWSPPGWMKASGSMLGGSMRRNTFPPTRSIS